MLRSMARNDACGGDNTAAKCHGLNRAFMEHELGIVAEVNGHT